MSRTNPPKPANAPKSKSGLAWLAVTVLGMALLVVVGHNRSTLVQAPSLPPATRALPASGLNEREPARSAFWSLSNPRHHSTSPETGSVSPRIASLQSALARALLEKNPQQKTAAMENLANEVTEGELLTILKALSIRDLGTEFASLLVRRQAGLDPAVTSAWVGTLPAGPVRNEMMSQLAIIWSGLDPARATEWLDQLPDDPARTTVAMVLAAELARTDQPSALGIAAALPSSDSRDNLIAHTVAEWAVNDPTAVASWIGQIKDQTLHDRLIGALAASTAKQDGSSAANLIASQMQPGAIQDQAAMSIVLRWVQTDPERTAEWVDRFPEGPLRQTALENLAILSRPRNPSSPAP